MFLTYKLNQIKSSFFKLNLHKEDPKENTDQIQTRSRTAATSKMERFVTIVNGFQSLTIITKRSILDVAEVLDPPLKSTQVTSRTL